MSDPNLRTWAFVRRLFLEGVVIYAVLFVAVVGGAAWYFLSDDTSTAASLETAARDAKKLRSAVLQYYARHQAYPDELDDLVTEKNGRARLIDGGPNALIDPWGNRYRFDVVAGSGGFDEVVVWTEAPTGERIGWPTD